MWPSNDLAAYRSVDLIFEEIRNEKSRKNQSKMLQIGEIEISKSKCSKSSMIQ